MEQKGFSGGLAWAGGVVAAVLLGTGVIVLLFLGCGGVVYYGYFLQRQEQREKVKQAEDLLAREHQRQMEQLREQAERERARGEQERERDRERQRMQERLERERAQAAAAEVERRRLEAQKEEALTERRRMELREAEEQRKREERAAEERRLQEEREADRKRAEEAAAALRRPLDRSVDQLYTEGRRLEGRLVRVKAEGEVKIFEGGHARIKFHDRGVLKVEAQVESIHPKLGLMSGKANVTVQGLVDRNIGGVLYLRNAEVLEAK